MFYKAFGIYHHTHRRVSALTQYQHDWLDAARLTVVVGHFGSGKTEFSVNMALRLADIHSPVALADLDVVDPYFRSRECSELFSQRGIRLISSAQTCMDADLPSMPPEVMVMTDNPDLWSVMDIGGDASGARVLARYRHRLKACNARVFCVINANRPLTDTPEKAVSYIRSIEAASGMPINGLVNNTHLCGQTELEDILAGAAHGAEISAATGIPVICHAAPRHLADEAAKHLSSVFPIDLYMKKPWE